MRAFLILGLVALPAVAAAGGITVDPPSVDFGALAVSQSKTITVTVANTGVDAYTILGFMAGQGIKNPIAPGTVIAPGKSVQFDVTVAPLVAGMFSDEVVMTTDDPAGRLFRIPVNGIAVVTMVRVAPDSIDFNSLLVGSESTPTVVTISNPGAIPLTVKSIVLGGTNSGQFKFDGPAPPFLLDTGKSQAIVVTYAPVSGGSHSATVTISADVAPPAVLKLAGTAIRPQGGGWPPAPLEFGNVGVGSSSPPQQLMVRNSGVLNVLVTSIVSRDPAFVVDGADTTFTIAAGQTALVNVVFKPITVGSVDSSIDVNIRGSASPVWTVMVHGMGTPTSTSPSTPGGCTVGRTRRSGGGALLAGGLLATLLVRRRRR